MYCGKCGSPTEEGRTICAACEGRSVVKAEEVAVPAVPAKRDNPVKSTATAMLKTVVIVSFVLMGTFVLRLFVRGVSSTVSFNSEHFVPDLLCFIAVAISLFGSVFGIVFGHLNLKQPTPFFFKMLMLMLGIALFGEVAYLVCELIVIDIKTAVSGDQDILNWIIMLSVFVITAIAVCFVASLLSKIFLKRETETAAEKNAAEE